MAVLHVFLPQPWISLFFHVSVTWPAYPVFLDLIIQIFGEERKSWSCWLWQVLQLSVTCSLHVSLSSVQTLSVCSFLKVWSQDQLTPFRCPSQCVPFWRCGAKIHSLPSGVPHCVFLSEGVEPRSTRSLQVSLTVCSFLKVWSQDPRPCKALGKNI